MKATRLRSAKRLDFLILMLCLSIGVVASKAEERQNDSATAQQQVEANPKTTPAASSAGKPEAVKAGDASTSPPKKAAPQASEEPKQTGSWLRKYFWAPLAFILGLIFKNHSSIRFRIACIRG